VQGDDGALRPTCGQGTALKEGETERRTMSTDRLLDRLERLAWSVLPSGFVSASAVNGTLA
jgi:hypothetical protein